MIKLEYLIETKNSKFLLMATNDSQKTNICLIKICNADNGKTIGENLEKNVEKGKIIKARLELHGQVKIDVKKDPTRSITVIEIMPQT